LQNFIKRKNALRCDCVEVLNFTQWKEWIKS